MRWISNDDHGAFAARGVHGQTIWIDPAADMVTVRFASYPTAANAASDLTSLPAYRAVADHLMAHDQTPLLGQEWVIESIAGNGVVDGSRAALQFLPEGRLACNATCSRFFGNYESDAAKLRIQTADATKMACPRR